MKALLGILLAWGSGVAVRGDVATSANYAMTIVSIDGGGRRSGSANYTNDLALGTIAVRSVASISVVNLLGYVAQMNNPPVAVDDVRSHPLNIGLDVSSQVFLANDFDIDGDLIQILRTDVRSEALGTVSYARGRVQYTAPLNFNGIDHFDYIALDANGDVAEATVTVVVAPAVETQPINTIRLYKLADGELLLRLRQETNRTEYHIEAATDLNLQNWTTIAIPRAQLDGIVEILINPADRQRYFRSVVF
jgi:hypothetical protein